MINIKYLKLLRSNRKISQNNFIYNIIAKRIVDSIDILSVNFEDVLEIGINDDTTLNYIKNKFNKSRIHRVDFLSELYDKNYIELDFDSFKFNNNFYNLIYSNFFFHLMPNLNEKLNTISKILRSNGFFIIAIPDKENIYQLLNSMYETDLKLYEGAYQRINPTLEINNILSMLKNLNFDVPMVNSDTIRIEYSKFSKLLSDLKNMSLTYCYDDKKQNFENKNYFRLLENIYKNNYYNGNFLLDIKLNIVSAWKK